jgi:acyl carrier protein
MVSAEARRSLGQIGIRSIAPEHAMAAIEQLLASSDHPQVAVADIDWRRFGEFYSFGRQRQLLAEVAPAPGPARENSTHSVGALDDEVVRLAPQDRRDWLIRTLQREVATVLDLDGAELPDVRTGFFRLGMDSLMAVELKDRLVRAFGIPFPATLVIDYPNIAELAEHVDAAVFGCSSRAGSQATPVRSEAPVVSAQDEEPGALPASISEKLAKLESLLRNS